LQIQGNGANLGTDRVMQSVSNAVKSTAGVMSSVFSSLGCDLGSSGSDEDELVRKN